MNLRRVQTALRHSRRIPEVFAGLRALKNPARIISAYVGVKRLPLPSTVEFRNGLRYRLEEYYDLETLWQINFHNVYTLAPTDNVILDAGANVGLFACWAAQQNPNATIIAIEPFQQNFERLMEHVRQNGLGDRVKGIRSALSSSTGTARFSTEASASQMFRLSDPSEAAGSVEVPTLTLADLLDRLPQKSIDLMKMDIEGSEYDVLLSAPPAVFARIRRISLEYHKPGSGSGHSKKKLVDYLKSCGYTSVIDGGGMAEYGMLHFSR